MSLDFDLNNDWLFSRKGLRLSWKMPFSKPARGSRRFSRGDAAFTSSRVKAMAPFLKPPQFSGRPSKVSNPRKTEPGWVFFCSHQKKELPEATPNSRYSNSFLSSP